jgi:hypothetical protein
MKKYATLSVALLGGMVVSSAAMADSRTGKIDSYHLSRDLASKGMGVCIRMAPPLPGTQFACLQRANGAYREITDLLRDAFIAKKTCTVVWYDYEPAYGHAVIDLVQCERLRSHLGRSLS